MEDDSTYRSAEEKILETLRTRADTLDLAGAYSDDTKIAEVPESLRQLTFLQSLDLSQNKLEALPEWLQELTELRSLNVEDNQLTRLPRSWAESCELET